MGTEKNIWKMHYLWPKDDILKFRPVSIPNIHSYDLCIVDCFKIQKLITVAILVCVQLSFVKPLTRLQRNASAEMSVFEAWGVRNCVVSHRSPRSPRGACLGSKIQATRDSGRSCEATCEASGDFCIDREGNGNRMESAWIFPRIILMFGSPSYYSGGTLVTSLHITV